MDLQTWLIDVTPPEAASVMLWASSHFEQARALALAIAAAYLLAMFLVCRYVYRRWFRSDDD